MHSYLKQTKMSFLKNKNQEQEGTADSVKRACTSERGEDVGKGCRWVNMVQILYTHIVNGNMRPAETIPGMGKGR
jgi:hypothetical protein